MADRMDQLVAAAVRQGFKVWQTKRGAWVFAKGSLSVIEASTPTRAVQWVRLIGALRGVGLVFPEENQAEPSEEI
ncbi:hypothetical protein H7I77_09965 [Mycolicibacterium novocastrense]|uniref:Transmembrane protein C2orf18 homolog n=1 Tax=Mycolicibacterium novocastrense TaxID=59813 RepID=A0AAW5SJH8_MYCNV|nr:MULTISPECIES: hypothetical protein [Mycolicibacterium]MCV7023671.1 hypothetical protein [Mycolicibacterium novocastrense]MDX1886908.1 hypothetical protein [Mycolicibacterium sp. 120270]GAT07683.1 transmembrane protein C2orf18 homolog [Mycolicibacterium novocastrense]